MEFSNSFNEAVAKKDITTLRVMLKNSLLVDPTFGDFKEMERAASAVDGLYDVHDGRPFEENSELWDDDYMNKIMVQVVGNFSHERIEHIKKIVRKLRPVTEQKETASSHRQAESYRNGKSAYQAQKQRDQAAGNYRETKIVAGAVVCGAVGCAVGCAVGAVAASSAAVGAAVGAVGGAVIGAAAVAACCGNNERK